MAIDTEAKRLAVLDLTLPFLAGLPLPDGDFSQGDRMAVLHLYPLIPVGTSVGGFVSKPSIAGTTSQPSVSGGSKKPSITGSVT